MSKHLDEPVMLACFTGKLSEAQESAAQEHLDRCEACRTRFEQLACSPQEWQRISSALRLEQQAVRLSGSHGAHGISESWPTADSLQARSASPHYPAEYANAPIDFAVSFLEPSEREGVLGRLGDFDIHSVIGFGGMGIVLKGFQDELNRPVAVKVMAPHLATSAAARKRFLREAQATAAIVHPNVMPILSVSDKGMLPFLVMPYVACHSLQQRLDVEGTLPIVEVLRIALQVAEGLAAAHAQGLVHRDVKPANILLERGVDRALLTDFGLARAVDDATLTRSGVIAGTPQYMSPEQARGDAVDARSDLFSLGSVIYAMCVGHPPFRAETSYGILRKVTDSEPRPMRLSNSDVPDWLERLTQMLMTKERDQRLPDANHVATLLRQCLAQVQQPMSQTIPQELQPAVATRGRASRRKRVMLFTFISLLVVTVGAIGWNVRQRVLDHENAKALRAVVVYSSDQANVSDDESLAGVELMNDNDLLEEFESVTADVDRLMQELDKPKPSPSAP